MRLKYLFFDSQAVVRAVGRAKRAVLSKAGAFIRTTARRSIRKKKGPAPPGQPPHSHKGQLRQFIFFGYDPGADSVVIGPQRLARSTDAPHTLEFGGTVTNRRDRLVPVGQIGRDTRGRYTKRKLKRIAAGTRLTIRQRPFMGPALEKERPKLPRLWAGSVKG